MSEFKSCESFVQKFFLTKTLNILYKFSHE